MKTQYKNYYGFEPSAGRMNPVPSPDVLRLLFRLKDQRDDPLVQQLLKVCRLSDDVLDLSPSEFAQRLRSNKDRKLFSLNLILEFVCSRMRIEKQENRNSRYSSKIRLLMRYFASFPAEQAVFIPADSRKKEPEIILVGIGDSAAASISLREIVKQSIAIGTHKIILAHNHPDRSAAPSESDVSTTISLRSSLSDYDIELADHIIFGCDEPFSMKSSEYFSYIFKGSVRQISGPPVPEEIDDEY